jgi:hypothetical protein
MRVLGARAGGGVMCRDAMSGYAGIDPEKATAAAISAEILNL